MWLEKRINYGETRLIYFDMVQDDFPISPPANPCWELTEYETGRVESSGVCSVEAIENGYTLYALITPQHVGLYRLIYSFGVGQELRRPCMIIKVR